MSNSARLELPEHSLTLPLITGTEGEKAIDISKLRAQSGYITLDYGYTNTGSCTSAVTFIDGEQGVLKHRGFAIEELCEKSSFEELSLLLLDGKLPSQARLNEFQKTQQEFTTLPQNLRQALTLFPKKAHPMAVIGSLTMALAGFSAEQSDETTMAQLMAQLKTLATSFYCHSQGLELPQSSAGLSYSEDFLAMMFGEFQPEIAQALDVLFMLHADHEQNCSASTVRLVGSSHANLYSSIAAGISALWGPLHGGANQAVIEMLEDIQADGGDHQKYLDKAKDKSDPFRLMGFGHRVYKNFDPRARIIKKHCDSVLEKLGVNDPLLDLAKNLEEAALQDTYFAERKLYPNVDFYSGIIYKALGIPTEMFTVMFVLGRLPGWMAQWKEMRESSSTRIGRPRQVYTGETQANYIAIENR